MKNIFLFFNVKCLMFNVRWLMVLGLSFIIFHLSFSSVAAQSWSSKAAKSVFTLKTFGADGHLMGSANGFFISEEGDAVSSFTPFIGAVRAVVIDASGKELPVEHMLGANEMYDVAKFRVTGKKLQPLQVVSGGMPLLSEGVGGTPVWLLPYSVSKPAAVSGQIAKAETFQESYAYYTVRMQMPENTVGCPLLNANGEVLGIMQQPARQGDTLSYAISAAFVADMKITGLSLNDASLRKTGIPMAMPDGKEDALLMMYMAGSTLDSLRYQHVVDDFIAKFPKEEEGYINRAQLAFNGNRFADAARDMEKAISVSSPKDNAHYAYARMIYQKELFKSSIPFEEWSLDKAVEEANEAIQALATPVTDPQSPANVYRHLLGQIYFAQKKYDEALAVFDELSTTDIRSAEIYYEAARCHELKGDTAQMLAKLDSAVNMYSKPYLKEAAPYLWARALARMNAGKHRLAVQDMNEYEKLIATGLSAEFYYIREQAELSGKQFQQALNDITKATQLAPADPDYFTEKASVETRVGMYDEAIASARECIRLAPDSPNGYLLLGVALCQKGDKTEGLPQLQKAKELGSSQADALINKFR